MLENQHRKPAIEPPIYYKDELKSEAFSELILKREGFFEKWFLLIFVILIILIFSCSWFIHYPEVIKARAVLVATDGPKEVVIHQEGKLSDIFISNNQDVGMGDIICYVESSATPAKVILLERIIDSTIKEIEANNTKNVIRRFAGKFDNMGELQQNYQQFMNAYQEFKDYLGEGFYIRKKCLLGLDTVYLSKAQESLQQQKELLLKDLSLSEETYKVNQSLFDSKVISKQDHRVEQSKLLNKKITIPQVNSQILNNQSQMRDKRKEIFDLDHTISKQQDVFLQSAQVFKSQLNEWDKKYIIRAPINGKLILFAMAQAKHFSKTGTLLGYINPPKSEYYAEANLSQYNFGKIEVGQKVQLRFDAYPFQEFGFVTGSIGYVSDISLDSGFLTRINITDGLVTSSHKSLRYRDGLKAEAQIVTKDMRLSERFYYNIVSSLKQ